MHGETKASVYFLTTGFSEILAVTFSDHIWWHETNITRLMSNYYLPVGDMKIKSSHKNVVCGYFCMTHFV